MKYLLTAVAVCMAFGQPAQAETRTGLSGFTGVSAGGRYEVEIADGSDYAVNVAGADAGKLRARVRGRTLELEPDVGFWRGDSPRLDIVVRVTLPRLDAVAATRGVQVKAAGIEARNIALAANTGGSLEIDGTCSNASVAVSTAGSIAATDFRCNDASVAASTGGNARLYANGSLSAAASTGGIVRVAGSPSVTNRAQSLGGEIRVD